MIEVLAFLADPETTRSWSDVLPVTHVWYWQGLIVVVCYAVTMTFSGFVVIRAVGPSPPPKVPGAPSQRNAGRIIGKCENFLAVTMVMLGEYSGLGLVLAAKSIARIDAMKENPSYYLGGTLVNLVWSTIMGMLARFLVIGISK